MVYVYLNLCLGNLNCKHNSYFHTLNFNIEYLGIWYNNKIINKRHDFGSWTLKIRIPCIC